MNHILLCGAVPVSIRAYIRIFDRTLSLMRVLIRQASKKKRHWQKSLYFDDKIDFQRRFTIYSTFFFFTNFIYIIQVCKNYQYHNHKNIVFAYFFVALECSYQYVASFVRVFHQYRTATIQPVNKSVAKVPISQYFANISLR